MRWERMKVIGGPGQGPGRRWGHTCNAIKEGKLVYVFGGYYGQINSQTNQVHVFDTDSQSWSEPAIKGTPPVPRDSHTCTTVGDNLFVFGGTDGLNPLGDLHILDTSSNTWISPSFRGDAPEAREGHIAALVGKRIFIFGGCGKSIDNASEVYYNDLYILDTETFVWQRAVTSGVPPAARDSHSCSPWRNTFIVIGGEDENDYYLSDVYILDTDTLVWQKLDTSGQLLPPRAGHTSVAFGKNIFVFGGFTDDQNLYDDLYMLDVETGVWAKTMSTGDVPSARFSMSADSLDPSKGGVLFFFGGCNRSLEALDDMYCLHTDLVKDDGRDERRLEKLSLRKQLKMKCQEQYTPAPGTALVPVETVDIGSTLSMSNSSQQSQQYFRLNEYCPPTGKRTFHAKVTKNFATGFSIETVIDGKPLRGILFSTSVPSNLNFDGKKDAEQVGAQLNDNQELFVRSSPSHELQSQVPQTEAADASLSKNTGNSNASLSQEVDIRDSENAMMSQSDSEVNRTDAVSTIGNVATLENSTTGDGSDASLKIQGNHEMITE